MATNAELKEQQRRQWSGNAPGWDAMHDRLERETAGVTAWLCREAGLAPGMHVLDLACGSGHPALDAARMVAPGGRVVATDLVPEMVEATKRRAQTAGLDNLEARVMDAEAMDYPDATFDAVTCRFGIMFCPQTDRAVREVRRVLKPGGRFAMSAWDEPEQSPAFTVVGEALSRFGRPQPPVDFDVPGVYQLAPPGKLQRLLEGAGFEAVRVESLPMVWEFDSIEPLWERQAARGPLRTVVEQSSSGEIDRLKEVLGVVEPYLQDGVIRLPVTPLCAVATK
jgi:SAM-dependent methyltransferase